jgi:hypothetical protein
VNKDYERTHRFGESMSIAKFEPLDSKSVSSIPSTHFKNPEAGSVVKISSYVLSSLALAKPLSAVTAFKRSGQVESLSFRENAYSMMLANQTRPLTAFTQPYTHHPPHYPMRHPASTLVAIVTQVLVFSF